MKKNILLLSLCLFSSLALAMEGQGNPDEQDSSENNIPFLQDNRDATQPPADVARDATGYPIDLTIPAALLATTHAAATPWVLIGTESTTEIFRDVRDEENQDQNIHSQRRIVDEHKQENIIETYQRFVFKPTQENPRHRVRQTTKVAKTKRSHSVIDDLDIYRRNHQDDDSRGGGNSSLSL